MCVRVVVVVETGLEVFWTAGVIVVFTAAMVDAVVTARVTGVGVDMFAGFEVAVMVVEGVICAIFVTESSVREVRAGLWAGAVFDKNEMFDSRVGPDTVFGVVTGIAVAMSDREVIGTRESLEY